MSAGVSTMPYPSPVGPQRYSDNYPSEPRTARQAREDIALYLRTWGLDDCVETAKVVVSDLVTHLIMLGDVDEVSVEVTRTEAAAVRMIVTGSGGSSRPAVEGGAAHDSCGMFLIPRLTPAWGVGATPEGRRFWADLATSQGNL